jgi:ubiquinone/menaquinone biosynthesis C-methylase UbiE
MSNSSLGSRGIETARAIEKYLVCPETHHALVVHEETISCTSCGFKGRIQGDVAVMLDGDQTSFFDDKVEIMRQGILERGANWRLSAERQVALLESHFAPGQVILDVGCGPQLPYQKPSGVFAIGLEPSIPSIRENKQVDLKVSGTATHIPLPNHSVDIAVAFYSVHHMVGATIAESDTIVQKAFSEMGRVIKPGGSLFVFEMSPWRPFAALQRLLWNQARRWLGAKLDMYFRSAQSMFAFGHLVFPNGSLEIIDFRYPPFKALPPVFSLPWLYIPKLFYPFEARLYKWQL